ncbi:MAG: hypothetical protein JJE04_19100, partial [Acidobacteriia bacterium]|nr:hypothetical protein [Terriglobia bacterium]
MRIREWFRPPRHVLTIFLAVALVSGTALATLAWLLVRQDKALELQRRQERMNGRSFWDGRVPTLEE